MRRYLDTQRTCETYQSGSVSRIILKILPFIDGLAALMIGKESRFSGALGEDSEVYRKLLNEKRTFPQTPVEKVAYSLRYYLS